MEITDQGKLAKSSFKSIYVSLEKFAEVGLVKVTFFFLRLAVHFCEQLTWMLGFCLFISALERSGKLFKSSRNAPWPSLCTLLPCTQGRVEGWWAVLCSGPDRRSSGVSWEDELLLAFKAFV